MLVELDIFSGRPNPRWQLDEHIEQQLLAIIRRLGPGPSPPPEPPGLGYRGFCYTLDGVTWRAWNGTVASPDGVLHDQDRSVERLLLDQLPDEYGDLRSRLALELEPDA